MEMKTHFSWSMGSTITALRELSGITYKELNLDYKAGIEVFKKGRSIFRDIFGEDVSVPVAKTPTISYGHVNCLGSELLFPENGEVGHTHIYTSLQEGISALKVSVEFSKSGMAPFYLEYREKLIEAFPDEHVGFGFGGEGPITTAYLMRGDEFFMDLYDDSDLALEFLELLTGSINSYFDFTCKVKGIPVINPEAGGLSDDLSSLIPHHMWEKFVLPFWEKYYRARTTGKRNAHVENLRATQLKYLESIGLDYYDPSVSPLLTPDIIAKECRVPFGWRLVNFHYWNMSKQDVRDFVYKAVADGASHVFSNVSSGMLDHETIEKVFTFISAAKEVEKLLDAGASREEIGKMVSPEGSKKFWKNWVGFKGN